MTEPRMVSADEVMRRLAADDASASASPPAALASTHTGAAANALGLLADREVTTTADLIAYAQAEATLAIALTLIDLRNLLGRGKP